MVAHVLQWSHRVQGLESFRWWTLRRLEDLVNLQISGKECETGCGYRYVHLMMFFLQDRKGCRKE